METIVARKGLMIAVAGVCIKQPCQTDSTESRFRSHRITGFPCSFLQIFLGMTLSSMGLDAEETPTVKKLHKRSFAAYDNPEWSDSEEEHEKEDTDVFKFTRPLSSEEPRTTKWKKISAAPDTQYLISCGKLSNARYDCWTCREPPCQEVRFMDWSSYEAHLEWHKLACFECYRHFPTEQMLNLHLEEEHNPFVKAPHGRRKGSPKVIDQLRGL